MKRKHDNRSLPVNRNYKDTIFRWLFSDKKNLLSLYNAIAGAHYQNPEALNIVTLENAIYMGMKNDLAFDSLAGSVLYCKRISVSHKSKNFVFVYLTDYTDSKVPCIL